MTSSDAMRDLLIEAAREFNARRYFEAHEVLEEGLDAVPDAMWDLFVGLIQIAVGYHKVTQHLWTGARAMLLRGLEKVEAFEADAAGLNLEPLRDRVRDDIDALGTGAFDAAAFERQPPRLQPIA